MTNVKCHPIDEVNLNIDDPSNVVESLNKEDDVVMTESTLTAETVEQIIGDAINTLLSKTGKQSVETDISDPGTDEFWKTQMGNLFNNTKRTYDEFQHESLETVRRDRDYTSKVLHDAEQYDNQRQVIANQALQNAVETANMVGKQAVRHGDVAIDRQWNVDEQGYQVDAIISALKPTLETVVAKILADMAGNK